jgi:DNA-binding Lrp family transcriptional regulator
MRLLDREKKILHFAQFNADASVSDLARSCGLKASTVRYTLQKLKSQKFIEEAVFVDCYRLGYQIIEIHFEVDPKLGSKKHWLLKTLAESQRVCWLRELTGELGIGLAICVKHSSEISDFIDEIIAKTGPLFLEKVVVVRQSFERYRMRYLYPNTTLDDSLLATNLVSPISIDDTDRAILTAISRFPGKARSLISEMLAMPHSTFEYRIRQLRENGIIKNFIYQSNVTQLGIQHFYLRVFTNGVDQALRKQMRSFCRRHINVDSIFETLAPWDFVLGVEVEESSHIIKLQEELHQTFGPRILRIKSASIYETKKMLFYPFDAPNGQ